MNVHLTMNEPDRDNRLDEMAQGVIGTPQDRPDGRLKVTGQATYAHEWNVPNQAYGVLVRATATKGRVRSVDTAGAKALPGVIDVVMDERFVMNPAQGMANAAPNQPGDEVRYFGQPIALVVATTFEQARHAAQTIAVEIAKEDGVVALASAPLEDGDESVDGDLDAAMAEAAASVDVTYTTAGHAAAAMEPHASIASWDGDRLTLRGSYQMLKFNRNELADSLGIDPENVTLLSPYVGGGFGSKLGIAPEAVAAAIAAKALGRPVNVTMSRQQVFEQVLRRSETEQHIRLAATADGVLTGIGHEAIVSNAPEEAFSEPVTQATPWLYRGENRVISEKVRRLNVTPAGSVRAPGEAVGIPTLEAAMDELAERLGIDPVELRLKNIPDVEPVTGKPYSSRLHAECLREGAKRFGWASSAPKSRREGEWYVGTGMASAARVNMVMEGEARVTLSPDGTATVETDMTDIGTGTYAILTQIAAESLGLAMAKVETRLGDTTLPPGPGSGGSWGASTAGSAVFLACRGVRERIAERLGVDETALTLKDGMAIAGNRRVPLAEALGDEPVTATGHMESGDTDEAVRQASYGAYFCEVGVNAVTGETRVRRMLGVFSAGRILNPKTARSQCLGGLTWGVGIALLEGLEHDPRDGHVVNRDLAEYHVPVNADVPQLDILLLDERDPWTCPIQSKGIGELGLCGAAGAVINAVYNACGVRVRDWPATPDKIFPHLHEA